MAIFNYKATDSTNQITKGAISAPNKEEAAQILAKKGLKILTLKAEPVKVDISGQLPDVERITFCRYMGTMLNSGLSLTEGVPVLRQEAKNPLMRQILEDISFHLERGQTLSAALSNYPKAFNKFFITLIKAGEVSGTLSSSFSYLEKQLRAEYSLSQKIKSSMMYPSIVFIAMIGIGFLMFFFILPQIGNVFLNMTIPLPAVTRTLFTVSLAAAKIKFLLMGLIVIAMVALVLFLKRPMGKKIITQIIAPLPVVSRLLQQIDIARFCRIFSTLVASAVPITDALDISLSSLSHPKFKNIAKNITQQVVEGKTVSTAFTTNQIFPPLLTQMIAAGEKSGTLDTSLSDLAGFYEEEVEEAVKKATQLLEPMLMLVVGIGVGAIILMIIAPLYSVVGNLQGAQ